MTGTLGRTGRRPVSAPRGARISSIPSPSTLFWGCAAAASCAFALWTVVDTLRAVVPLLSPLPWFDDWATVDQFSDLAAGRKTLLSVLFEQNNEHRLVFPRLVFLADDLWFGGQERLTEAAIFLVQAAHAALFITILARARPARIGRWAIAGVVVALMFNLRQDENFSTGFQLQFVGVFAAATLAFVLFGRAAARASAALPLGRALGLCFVAVLVAAFTMANGLIAGYVIVVLALAARLRPRIMLGCAAWAVLLTLIYAIDYQAPEDQGRPLDALLHPFELTGYVVSYLGNIPDVGRRVTGTRLGSLGVALTVAAAWRIARRRPADPGAAALFGVMLFVGASAVVTATGRLHLGLEQAFSSRYVTGSMAFWAAQLCYWWVDPPTLPLAWTGRYLPPAVGPRLARFATMVLGLGLANLLYQEQSLAKPQLYVQSFAQNEAANLLLLGLDDPAAIERTAWSDDDVHSLVPAMKELRISIFGGPDAGTVGRPVAERGAMVEAGSCGGGFDRAASDPRLGRDGVRVSGRAWSGTQRRLIRRIILADADGNLAGLASGANPGAGTRDWRGYAVAPAGAALTAYAVLDGERLCPVGTLGVDAAIPAQTVPRGD